MATPRVFKVAAAQMGPNQLSTPRSEILSRMINMLNSAASQGAKLVVYPEIPLTAFFPVHLFTDEAQLADFFEPESFSDPHAITKSARVKPLFDRANELKVDLYLGYAERWTDASGTVTDYNTTIYYSGSESRVLAKYRKVHLPGTISPIPAPGTTSPAPGDKSKVAQQLEKRYFSPGNLGFRAFRAPNLVPSLQKSSPEIQGKSAKELEGKGDPILGMLTCNDRRWPEAWRCYGLQGVELVLQGFNTTAWAPQYPGTFAEQEELALLHHHISCQAGSYQNACWSVNVAKAGCEDGGHLIAGTCVYDPDGRLVAETRTKEDEVLIVDVDLERCRRGKERVFDFGRHRRPEHYARLVDQVGVEEPELL